MNLYRKSIHSHITMHVKISCSAFIIAFQLATPSYSLPIDVDSDYCENEWRDVVSEMRESLPFGSGPGRLIIFAGTDGKLFNCLNEIISRDLMEVLQYWSMNLSLAISRNASREGVIPDNYCNTSRSIDSRPQVMTIYMPYDIDEINSHECRLRLRTLSERVERFASGH